MALSMDSWIVRWFKGGQGVDNNAILRRGAACRQRILDDKQGQWKRL